MPKLCRHLADIFRTSFGFLRRSQVSEETRLKVSIRFNLCPIKLLHRNPGFVSPVPVLLLSIIEPKNSKRRSKGGWWERLSQKDEGAGGISTTSPGALNKGRYSFPQWRVEKIHQPLCHIKMCLCAAHGEWKTSFQGISRVPALRQLGDMRACEGQAIFMKVSRKISSGR